MTMREQIVHEARKRKGLRWRHQARLDGVATDCLGLILLVGLSLNLNGAAEAAADPRLKSYGRDPDYELALSALRRYMDEVDKPSLGDVIYMRPPRGTVPQHFAIVSQLDPPYMVHSWAFSRGVVENGIDSVWRSRIAHAFSFRGVD